MPNDSATDICDSLLVWISTFEVVGGESYSADDLTNGLVISSVLNEVRFGYNAPNLLL